MSEGNNFDVVVVSAFGRGHWLAAELQREKMRVLLLDVTSRLGNWPVEDQTGPFGVFRFERFPESHQERWIHDDPVESLANGFTVWAEGGPLEMKGPLTRLHLERMGWQDSWSEAIGHARRPSIPAADFSRAWVVALAQQIAATVYRPSARATLGGRPLPLTAPFGVRFSTRQGHARNLEWLRSRGVVASEKTEILDFSFEGRKRVSGAEVKGELSGLIRFGQLVWCLTGAETQDLSEKLAAHLYSGTVPEPDWCWLRYRLKVQASPEVELLPLHSVWIDELGAPWTHANLVVIQKTRSPESVDAWVRLPALQRFNKDYLHEHGLRVRTFVRRRLPLSEAEIQSYPQEATYTSKDLGQPRFPIWSEANPPARARRSLENGHFDSPENHDNHSLDAEYDSQKDLRDRLVRWWKVLTAKKEATP